MLAPGLAARRPWRCPPYTLVPFLIAEVARYTRDAGHADAIRELEVLLSDRLARSGYPLLTPFLRYSQSTRGVRTHKEGGGMSQQTLREHGLCAYCGRHEQLTVDHVIPRCLFDGVEGGVPGDVPKVGACRRCNNAKSADDVFFRDVLVGDARLAQHHVAQDIRHGAFARSIAKGKSQYPRAASRLRYAPSPSGSGLVIAEPVLPKGRLRDIFIRLVRGLMVVYEQYDLPDSINVDVLRAIDAGMALDEARRWAETDTSGMVHSVQAGDGSVFRCVYYHTHSQERPNLSHWWLHFYERSVYVVFTDTSNLAFGEF